MPVSDSDDLRLLRERIEALEAALARDGNAESPGGQAILVQTYTLATYPTTTGGNETQTITSTHTAGSAPWSWNGNATTAIAYNATAATILAALTALPGIGAGNILVTGGPLNTTPVVATFAGTLANAPQPAITIGSGLTGGTISAVETRVGSEPVWYAVQRLTALGLEAEGNQAAVSVDSNGFFALCLGSTIPPVNAQVIVEWIDYAYAFRYDA